VTGTIRPVRPSEIDRLRQIEIEAGARFSEIGMQEIAEDEPPSAALLASRLEQDRLWVAVDDDDVPIGYVSAGVVGGLGHIEQLSVVPSHGGQGVGRRLVEHVCGWAQAAGSSAVTLSTFGDVAWNRPLYERMGFRVLAEPEVTPALREVRAAEGAAGLDVSTRVFMQRELPPVDVRER